MELGDSGVRCNAILPAATATPMLLAGFEGAPEKFQELSSMHPVGRICDPREIGEFIAFLGSVCTHPRARSLARLHLLLLLLMRVSRVCCAFLAACSIYAMHSHHLTAQSTCCYAPVPHLSAQDSSRFITGSELQIDGGIGGRLHDPV